MCADAGWHPMRSPMMTFVSRLFLLQATRHASEKSVSVLSCQSRCVLCNLRHNRPACSRMCLLHLETRQVAHFRPMCGQAVGGPLRQQRPLGSTN